MSEKASTYLLSQTRGRKSEKQMAEREEEGRVMICQHLSSEPSVCSSSLRFFKHAARGKEETGGVERKRHNLCTKDTSTTFKGILCLC